MIDFRSRLVAKVRYEQESGHQIPDRQLFRMMLFSWVFLLVSLSLSYSAYMSFLSYKTYYPKANDWPIDVIIGFLMLCVIIFNLWNTKHHSSIAGFWKYLRRLQRHSLWPVLILVVLLRLMINREVDLPLLDHPSLLLSIGFLAPLLICFYLLLCSQSLQKCLSDLSMKHNAMLYFLLNLFSMIFLGLMLLSSFAWTLTYMGLGDAAKTTLKNAWLFMISVSAIFMIMVILTYVCALMIHLKWIIAYCYYHASDSRQTPTGPQQQNQIPSCNGLADATRSEHQEVSNRIQVAM